MYRSRYKKELFIYFINVCSIKFNVKNTLEVRESHLSWYLSDGELSHTYNSFCMIAISADEIALQELTKKFWELEEVKKNTCSGISLNYVLYQESAL